MLNLTGCTYNGAAARTTITKPITIIGARINLPTNDRWGDGVGIDADNVTLYHITFTGGGQVVAIFGHSNVRVLNSTFDGQIGGAVTIWGASRYILIQGNRVTQTKTHQVSPMGGRGSEDCSTRASDVTFRNNVIDQGPGTSSISTTVGWFGIELKCFQRVTIEGNSIKGGHTLVSLPDTNQVTVRNNTFDMRGYAYWAVEVAHAMDVTIENNTVIGDSPTGNDHAFSTNSGSQRTTVRNNSVQNARTLFDGGYNSSVTDNCLANVRYEIEYQGPNVTLAGNGPC